MPGGGSNFGVVYEFEIQLFPHPGECFGGMLVLTPDKLPDLVTVFGKWWDNVTPDTSFTMAIAAPPPAFQVSIPL
jgi:hypothetical protein